MSDHLMYFSVLAGCMIVPFIFSFYPKIRFYREWKFFLPVSFAVGIFFIGWDVLFTHLGVWNFNPRYVTGPALFGLPVEELLFFFFIPYCSVFTLYCFDKFIPLKKNDPGLARKLSLLSGAALLILAVIFAGRKYTVSTFALLAIFLFFLGWKMPERLPRFFLVYLVILIPFFLSNGILTGSFIDEPVVRYNDAENLGLRLFTIPAEDVFYGMLLLLMNFAGYAFFRDRSAKNANA